MTEGSSRSLARSALPATAIHPLLQEEEVSEPSVTLVVDPNRIKDLLADLLKEHPSNDVDRAANQD